MTELDSDNFEQVIIRINEFRSKRLPSDAFRDAAINVTYAFRDLDKCLKALENHLDTTFIINQLKEKGHTPEDVRTYVNRMRDRVEVDWEAFNKHFFG